MPPQRSAKVWRKSLESSPEVAGESLSQPLFSGLCFYFFPSSRVNRARALKINKTIQNGGSLCPRWNPHVTHIIMDDGMPWECFTKYHKELKELPENVVVVNSRYITDCMAYGVILAHNQRVYSIPGYGAPENESSMINRNAFEATCPTKSATTLEPNHQGSQTDQEAVRTSESEAHETKEHNSIVQMIGRTDLPQPNLQAHSVEEPVMIVTLDTPSYDDELSALVDEARSMTYSPLSADAGTDSQDSARMGRTASDISTFLPSLRTHTYRVVSLSSIFYDAQGSVIIQRPSDCSWVKMRCKECGEAKFQDIRAFLEHCAFKHKRRFKTQNEAIEECGFPLNLYSPNQSLSPLLPPLTDKTSPDRLKSDASAYRQQDTIQERPAKNSKTTWQENFACMWKHDGKSREDNPNADIIECLQEMADFYERTNDRWRSLSFRRGVSALKKQKRRISTKEEALKIPCVGDSIAKAVEKIVHTGKLSRLETIKADSHNQVLQLFTGIYGVGICQATRWVSTGFRTLEDLRTKAQLTDNQRIGLDHYYDLQQRIPRSEVQAHGNIFKSTLSTIDSEFQVTIGGSYRRGSPSSGDIDLIITKPRASLQEIRTVILNQAVPKLFAIGFLKAELARTSSENGSKWHGCTAIANGPWRRIDFLLVPWNELGAALIYFTGNDIFNRSIRLLASRKGMRLNQRGLYKDVLRGKGRERVTEGELLESTSEKKIFDILGVPWRPPEHRNC